MKDNVSNLNIDNQIKLPNYHGHTKIKLKNIKTGMTDIIESDNTFQPTALEHFVNYGYQFNARLKPAFLKDLKDYLLGGIYLFNQQIPAGTEFIPAGNRMIGNGARDITNATDPIELGSFNSVDSESTATTFKQVWDFNQNQANGEINCVCLGNRYAAQLGVGNRSNTYKELTNWTQATAGQKFDSVPYLESYNSYIWRYNDVVSHMIGNYAYCFYWNNTDKTITIYRIRVPQTSFSIFNYTVETYCTLSPTDLDNYDLGISSEYLSYIFIGYIGDNTFRIMCNLSNKAAGTVVEYIEINVSTKTAVKKSLTVPANLYATRCFFYGTKVENGNTIKNYILLARDYDTRTTLYFIDIRTGDILKTITNFSGATDISLYTRRIVPDGNLGIFKTYMVDFNLLEVYRCNSDNDPGPDTLSVLDNNVLTVDMGYTSYFYPSPYYLGTINNLSETVEKTSAHTMQVIYTLEEV